MKKESNLEFVLHIGQSKTGTTSLQTFLSKNRLNLKKQGVLYPDIKKQSKYINFPHHNPIADLLMSRSVYPYCDLHEFFKDLYNQTKNNSINKIILSGENFFGGEPRIWDTYDEADYLYLYGKKLKNLSNLIGDNEVKIIIYLRNHIEWLRSTITHTIRFLHLHDNPNVYQSDEKFLDLIKPLLKYSNLLNEWKKAFPNSKIFVKEYDKNLLINSSIIYDFCDLAELNASKLSFHNDIPSNISLSAEFIEVKKILNKTKKIKEKERVIIKCLDELSKGVKFRRYYLNQMIKDEVKKISEKDAILLQKDYGLTLSSSETKEEIIEKSDINHAHNRFKKKFNRISIQILIISYFIKSFIRNYFPSTHAFISNIKISYYNESK